MSEKKISLNTYKVSSPWTATVLENIKLTADSSPNDTRHVVINLQGSSYEYVEGQSVGILPPGIDEKGKPHAVRLYSIASHRRGEKGDAQSLSVCVKRVVYQDPVTGLEKRGVGSNFICDLKKGDAVRITGPVGNRFLLPEHVNDPSYIFIATGTGIAPFRGMLKELFQKGFQNHAWLIFGTPYRSDILYEKEFQNYETHQKFHFVTAVSREDKNRDGTKVYVQHRLLEHQKELVPILTDTKTLIYICGLKGIEKGIYETLQSILSPTAYEELRKRILVEVY
ncbi:MAG: ferredoxin--NADP(+) reductase [Chlamydiae bacterium]|nr:ferredoxin--NADP(+) reductase [Chlamydiota bacterium]MBI3276176.1 ferredoxin--NADP(+) reductase [Chlamydiota bacterium]